MACTRRGSKMTTVLLMIVALLVGRGMGWHAAHAEIVRECKRLGKFYVGNEVFHCGKLETITPDEKQESADGES